MIADRSAISQGFSKNPLGALSLCRPPRHRAAKDAMQHARQCGPAAGERRAPLAPRGAMSSKRYLQKMERPTRRNLLSRGKCATEVVPLFRTLPRPFQRTVPKLILAPIAVLLSSGVQAQTLGTSGTSTSPLCTEDPAYCSDIGATPSTNSSASSSSSSSSATGGSGSGAPPAIPNSPCGDGFPTDAWGECN